VGLLTMLRAEFTFVYADIFRRKSLLAMLMIYPYILTLFILLIGTSMGSPAVFTEKVGIDPVPFFIVSSFVLISVLGVVDDVLWRPIFDEWMGTLSYVISSPTSRVIHYLAIPIPRLSLVILSCSASVFPVLIYYYGITGLFKAFGVLGLTILSSLLLTTLAMVIAGLVFTLAGESWRILNIVRPLLLILLGAFYPRYMMPLTAQVMSWLVPSSHTVELLQRLLIGLSTETTYVLMLLGAAVALAIVYTPLGNKAIRHWEKKKLTEGVST